MIFECNDASAMAHGVIKRAVSCKTTEGKAGVGSRRIFAPHFKLQVLDSYRNDADCKGNQRATARKYGIHRRQIQKWLQAENNLRNSVREPQARKSGAEMTLGGRQRDDARTADERVPQQPPALPLDLRASPDPLAPMDLSLKRKLKVEEPEEPCCVQSFRPPSPRIPTPPHDPEVWDLSIKRRCVSQPEIQTPKPIKLFKPYLDECTEESCPKISELHPPCCNNNNFILHPEPYYYNNNVTELGYTLHEVQPAKSYYYICHPVPDYEVYPVYDDRQLFPSSPPLKQRQSYSLDFKLSAIECYYQDTSCRGNQRAVASKYNVHRRQVQKWLQQEEELRQRNDSVKQIHAVR